MPEAHHVFVSYVSEESEHVDALCKVLEAAQIPYWRDRANLGPGDAWKAKIREAITSNSLVFLACFSARSLAKTKSHMNEELSIAVGEFRKFATGRTWLIPVRFDETPVPEWDLGAGRMLSDLNYVNLFGTEHVAQAALLVSTIGRLMGAAGPDATTIQEAVAHTAEKDKPALVRRVTKEMLPDPTRRIELDDTIRRETRGVLDGLRDETLFSRDSLSGSASQQITEIVTQATRYWHLTEPFTWSLEVATRWAELGQLRPWTDGLKAFANEAEKPRGGVPALLDLRHVPGVIGTMAAGLAAVASERWDNLKALVVDSNIYNADLQRSVPLIDTSHPWSAFGNSGELVPHVLARTVSTDDDPATALEVFASRKVGKFHTPVAEWLHSILRTGFEEVFPDKEAYSREFDRAEIMLGLISQDLANQRASAESETPWPARSRWFGRSTWRANRYEDALSLAAADLQAQREHWPPLRAGLFGRDTSRAELAFSTYRETFDQIRSRHW